MSLLSYHQDRSDYYNRQTSISESHDNTLAPPRRQSTRRDASARSSEGTVNTMTSNNTAATGMTEPPAYSKKIVVVGDGGCGKTCLLISYSQGYFPEKYVPTVFENYITYPDHKRTGKVVELALWDTAGQEEYDRLRPLSYPETDLIFVCFAIDCPNSLDNVMDKWYPEVLHFCPYTPLVLVGLKKDLRTKKSCIDLLRTQGLTPVTRDQAEVVAKKMKAKYMECSSKEMIGVDEIFQEAIDIVVANDPGNQQAASTETGGSGRGNRDSVQDLSGGLVVKKKKRSCKIL